MYVSNCLYIPPKSHVTLLSQKQRLLIKRLASRDIDRIGPRNKGFAMTQTGSDVAASRRLVGAIDTLAAWAAPPSPPFDMKHYYQLYHAFLNTHF